MVVIVRMMSYAMKTYQDFDFWACIAHIFYLNIALVCFDVLGRGINPLLRGKSHLSLI